MDVRDLGAMMAAFMLAYGGFEMPWGRLGDRLARGTCCIDRLGGSLTTAAVAVVVLLPRSYPVSSAFLLGCGSCSGCSRPGRSPPPRMMADWMPTTERGSAQGFLWMCSRAGGAWRRS